jgi:flagellar biosynthesis protein FliQ
MSSALLHALREGLYLVLLLAAPPVLAVLAVGVASAFLQTLTRVKDPSLSAVPRLLAALGALVMAGPWIGAHALSFVHAVLAAVPVAARP